MMGYELQGLMLRLAKVAYVHPAGQHIDVIFLDSGEYCRNIQVMSPYAGTDFGFTTGIPEPEKEGWDENKVTDPDKRDIIAVVAYSMNYSLCLGFMFPQVTHLAFEKEEGLNRLIERSPSDHYRTIKNDADFEQYHPGDAWFRIAQTVPHEDLTGKDFDERWELKRNLLTIPIITLWNQLTPLCWADIQIHKTQIIIEVRCGSASASIVVTAGQVVITSSGNMNATSGGNINANAAGNINATAGGNATINAATANINAATVNIEAANINLTGTVNVNGTLNT